MRSLLHSLRHRMVRLQPRQVASATVCSSGALLGSLFFSASSPPSPSPPPSSPSSSSSSSSGPVRYYFPSGAVQDERAMTTAEREEAHTQAESCQSMLAKAFESRRNVGHMVGAMARAGCAIDPVEFVQCRPCDADVHIGGAMYGADSGHMEIVMCEGKLRGQKHFNETLTHELIHAYDFCRAEVDETNCRHHACTEIRAANLSHDCSYANEVARGKGYFLRDQHDKCVRRRAMLSVQANPNCSEAQCEQAVDEVWTRCISDVAPFGSVPF